MTSEVLVMNSMAVVLAADSALTRSSNNSNLPHYSNGGNKIFSLSTAKRANIGIMIYNSMHICGAPWELLIKSFRHENDDQTFQTVQDCSDNFFKFIRENETLISNEMKKKIFDKRLMDILNNITFIKPNQLKDELSNKFEPNKGNQPELDDKQKLHFEEIISKYSESVEMHNANKSDEEKLDALGEDFCIFIFKAHINGDLDKKFNDYTGIVISGFGETEEYPAFIENICYGFSSHGLSLEQKNKESISVNNQASLQGFAQSEMIELLLNRIDKDAFEIIMRTLQNEVLPNLNELNIDKNALEKVYNNFKDKSKINYINFRSQKFILPLKNSISAMSILELSTLAGTIVELEALNEKLSRPSQSVGGPTDIISITKNEGLIWIKRKHYFERDLNPKYFKNLN